MKFDESGGPEIHVSPKQAEGVPSENCLPSGGKDENVDLFVRVCAPYLEAMKTWKAPKAEKQGHRQLESVSLMERALRPSDYLIPASRRTRW